MESEWRPVGALTKDCVKHWPKRAISFGTESTEKAPSFWRKAAISASSASIR